MPVPFMVRVSTSRVALLKAGLKIGCSAKWLVPWSHPIDIEAFEIPLGMLHMVDAILIRRVPKVTDLLFQKWQLRIFSSARLPTRPKIQDYDENNH